ncbi:MAG: hypothetical protein AAF081_05160 [Actinomycetota bacterium]
MPTTFDPRPDGYVATFTGALQLADVEAIHAAAVDHFGDGTLRWAVLDMAEAWVDPPMNNGEEVGQLEIVLRLAHHVSEARTSRLRLAVVIRDEFTSALVRLTGTAAELAPSAFETTDLRFAQFRDLDEATEWATAD